MLILTTFPYSQDQWIGDADNSKGPGNFGTWRWCTDRLVSLVFTEYYSKVRAEVNSSPVKVFSKENVKKLYWQVSAINVFSKETVL